MSGGGGEDVLNLAGEVAEHFAHFGSGLIEDDGGDAKGGGDDDLVGFGEDEIGGGAEVGEEGELGGVSHGAQIEVAEAELDGGQPAEGEESGEGIRGEGGAEGDEHQREETPLELDGQDDETEADQDGGGDEAVGEGDALLAAEDFGEDAKREGEADAGEENDHHQAELLGTGVGHAEPGDEPGGAENDDAGDEQSDADVEDQDRGEHTAELVPVLFDGEFGDAFLGGEAEAEVEQDTVAEDAPEQRPEAELLGVEVLVEQAEGDEPHDHGDQGAGVIGGGVAQHGAVEFPGGHEWAGTARDLAKRAGRVRLW